jgi:hypothetical protein
MWAINIPSILYVNPNFKFTHPSSYLIEFR